MLKKEKKYFTIYMRIIKKSVIKGGTITGVPTIHSTSRIPIPSQYPTIHPIGTPTFRPVGFPSYAEPSQADTNATFGIIGGMFFIMLVIYLLYKRLGIRQLRQIRPNDAIAEAVINNQNIANLPQTQAIVQRIPNTLQIRIGEEAQQVANNVPQSRIRETIRNLWEELNDLIGREPNVVVPFTPVATTVDIPEAIPLRGEGFIFKRNKMKKI
jgi:hypothetical protein